jgi:hypothetical protein
MIILGLAAVLIIGIIIFMALNLTLRKVFLYIFASVGLVLSLIGLVSLINLGLRTYVFTKADYPCYYNVGPKMVEPGQDGLTEAEREQLARDEEKRCIESRTSEKQRSASNAIAMLIVGLPLYGYHWNTIRKDKEV